ncbi:MAG: hypothetical protein JST92_04160, partial [Deltaproteobacteria bacterium]|nr:hypothetical protein [Deltaproteobacteria bacterium]
VRADAKGGPTLPPTISADELELLSRSLRPEGREELTRNWGSAQDLPLSEVEAELDVAQARVDGHLRLLYKNREAAPLGELVFRLYPSAKGQRSGAALSIADVLVNGQKVRARTNGSVVEIALPQQLPPGATVELSLAFHAKLQRIAQGDDDLMAASMAAMTGQRPKAASYGTLAVSASGATLVDWYPQLAARTQGAWDKAEPGAVGDLAHADVGSALVSLTVPKGLRVVGPGAALGQHATGGKEQATFALMGLRGTMGLAVLRESDEASGEAAGVRIRAASLNGPEAAQAMLACASEALVELSRRFGPYPWTDLALAEVPLVGGAGGVELPGLSLIARAVSEGRDQGGVVGGLFAFTCHHEVAHQWWQALVGSDPRTAPWVDEALAQFSAVLVAEAAAGSQMGRKAGQLALERNVALNYQGMRLMGLADARVDKPTTQYKSPLQYAGLVYGKAPYLFVRSRELLGDGKLDDVLHTYRARFAFREAGPGDFVKVAGEVDPAHARQVEALDQRFIHEAHGDEDIPKLDPTELLAMGALSGMTGAGGLSQLLSGGGLEKLMDQLDPNQGRPGPHAHSRGGKGRNPGLGGFGAGGGNLGGGNPGMPFGAFPGGDPAELREALREMEKLMPGLEKLINEELKKAAQRGQQQDDEDEP